MLQAGVAIRDISPRKPMFLWGYPHVSRISTGVHDPLYATALCLRNETTAIVFVASDILMLSCATARNCRAAIARATGVPEGNILISSTHTHSGPVTCDALAFGCDPTVPAPDAEYLMSVVEAIVAAATEAAKAAVPARLAVTTANGYGVGGNRLSRDGLADPEVGVLVVRREKDNQPLAIQTVYSMHPTVMHEDTPLVSADFPGYARLHLVEQFPGVAVLYHTGPSGNQSPRYHVKGQTFTEAERLGRLLGARVLAAVNALKPADFTDTPVLAAARGGADLPARRFGSVAESESKLKIAVETFERLKREGAGHGPVRTAECAVFGAEEAVGLSKFQETGVVAERVKTLLPAEVQVIRVADSFWAGIPGEVFVEYGLEIKRRAAGRTFVISLANGHLEGYIVSPEAEAQGGYEAAFSLFKADAGRIMADQAVELVRQLAR